MKQRQFSRSLTLFFALKLHRNACYAGYNIPSLISSLICTHSILYLVFTVTLWLCFPSAESTYDPPRRTNFASFPWSLNSSDTHSHAFPNMSYISKNKIQFKHSYFHWQIQGRGLRGPGLNLIFRPNWGPKKIFWVPPPPPAPSEGMDPSATEFDGFLETSPWNTTHSTVLWDHIKPTHISSGECTQHLGCWCFKSGFFKAHIDIISSSRSHSIQMFVTWT